MSSSFAAWRRVGVTVFGAFVEDRWVVEEAKSLRSIGVEVCGGVADVRVGECKSCTA